MSWSWPKVFVRARSVLVERPSVTDLTKVSPFQDTVAEPPQSIRGSGLTEGLGVFPLSMEDYAELVVALCACAYPDQELLRRHGIGSEEELAQVRATWQKRLEDPSVRRRWLEVRDEVARRWAQSAA